jgi:hypothetical protein
MGGTVAEPDSSVGAHGSAREERIARRLAQNDRWSLDNQRRHSPLHAGRDRPASEADGPSLHAGRHPPAVILKERPPRSIRSATQSARDRRIWSSGTLPLRTRCRARRPPLDNLHRCRTRFFGRRARVRAGGEDRAAPRSERQVVPTTGGPIHRSSRPSAGFRIIRAHPGPPRGEIQPGVTRRGSLGDGDGLMPNRSYYELWRFTGRPGQLRADQRGVGRLRHAAGMGAHGGAPRRWG